MTSLNIDTTQYPRLLDEKANELKNLFLPFSVPALEVFPSAPANYRMRAEFRIWHDKEDMYYSMFNAETKEKIRVDSFIPASELINQLMPVLMEEMKSNQELRTKLFQIDFLSTTSGQILATLLYHKKLGENWIIEARALKEKLSSRFNLHLIGRARKQKIEIDQDFVIEELNVQGKKLIYKQIENSFTQPNAGVATKMLEWALDITQNSKGDLLELYCGNGNFSIALAPQFNKVLATELAGPSVEAAQYNIAVNGVDNLQIIRMSAEEFADAMKGTREYQRLKGIDLKSYQCSTILVDPPRAGLDDQAVSLVKEYENIIYISCNPLTLLENLKELSKTHEVKRFALFDQFPYTHHAEAGVYLVRK